MSLLAQITKVGKAFKTADKIIANTTLKRSAQLDG